MCSQIGLGLVLPPPPFPAAAHPPVSSDFLPPLLQRVGPGTQIAPLHARGRHASLGVPAHRSLPVKHGLFPHFPASRIVNVFHQLAVGGGFPRSHEFLLLVNESPA